MTGLVDIHAHFVYGVDDGAPSREIMFGMLDAARLQGVTTLYATAHETPGMHPFDMKTYRERLDEARAYCDARGYGMTLVLGAELLYTPAMDAAIQERRLTTMGDSDFVLVEFVPDISQREMRWVLRQLEDQGYRAILAHIERYDCMRGSFPFQLKKEFSVQYQINCRTVLVHHHLLREKRLEKWFRSGLVDYLATDMHNVTSRPPRMEHAYEKIARSLGVDVAETLTRAKAMQA